MVEARLGFILRGASFQFQKWRRSCSRIGHPRSGSEPHPYPLKCSQFLNFFFYAFAFQPSSSHNDDDAMTEKLTHRAGVTINNYQQEVSFFFPPSLSLFLSTTASPSLTFLSVLSSSFLFSCSFSPMLAAFHVVSPFQLSFHMSHTSLCFYVFLFLFIRRVVSLAAFAASALQRSLAQERVWARQWVWVGMQHSRYEGVVA